MNVEKIYQSLDNIETNNTNRGLLINYLKECSSNIQKNTENKRVIAYDIAGLLSTKYAQKLNENDPIDKILTLAGELEVDSQDNNADWLELIDMINSL